MKHAETLTQEIEQATARLSELDGQIAQCNRSIGHALTGAQPNEQEADRIQQERDTLKRERERCQMRINALQAELPNAEKADAQDRLAAIVAEAQNLAEANEQARKRYDENFANLMASIDAAYEPAVKILLLRDEATFLVAAHGLAETAVPDVAQPQPLELKKAYSRAAFWYEQLFSFTNPWREKIGQLNKERKKAA